MCRNVTNIRFLKRRIPTVGYPLETSVSYISTHSSTSLYIIFPSAIPIPLPKGKKRRGGGGGSEWVRKS
jgi:hypothetical protein